MSYHLTKDERHSIKTHKIFFLILDPLKSCAQKETLILKMSKRMKRSLPYLQILAEAKPKLRKILIKNLPESVVTAICECCLNTLKGVIPLTPRQKRRLAPYKTQLRALANGKVSRKRKKAYLTQRGGSFLPSILPAALGALRSFF